MITKELEEIELKDLYEVTGGDNKDSTALIEAIDKLYSKIKELITS